MPDRETTRSSITYHLPGGLAITYSGTRKTYWRWLAETWRGGAAMWRFWIRCAGWIAIQGHVPWPRLVTVFAAERFRTMFVHFSRPEDTR